MPSKRNSLPFNYHPFSFHPKPPVITNLSTTPVVVPKWGPLLDRTFTPSAFIIRTESQYGLW